MQPASKSRPTLADVAARAELSTATVSRFFSTPALLSPASAERVRAAIAELGYRPHGAARALASKRTGAIGAIVPTLDGAIFAAVLQALQRHVVAADMTLMVGSSNYDSRQEREQVDNLVVRGIDGVMLTGEERRPEVYETLVSFGVRYINAYVRHPGSPHPTVGFDNAKAMRRMVEYLYDLGHRRFGMIAGVTAGNDRARARVAGTIEGLKQRGIELGVGAVIERSYSIEEGRGAMRSLMAYDERPTAVVCGNDVLALGALFEARSMGLIVPNDVSVAGFDDLDIARQVFPGLTTVRTPVDEMGRLAADYLLGKRNLGDGPFQVELPAELVVRGSTGPAVRATR